MSPRVESLPPDSVQEAIRWACDRLADTSEPKLSAKLLLAHALHSTVTALFGHPARPLSDVERRAYGDLIGRRARHEPLAYLLGRQGFMDIDLQVDRRVLIPRPETEELVEHALRLAQQRSAPHIVDVGTGSGAISISLAVRLPQARITAIDASPDALAVARENAARNGVSDRIHLLAGDLLAPLRDPADLIVANLPYVSEDEYAALPPDIRLYEPDRALLAGPDGLDAIRALLDQAPPHLAARGAILLEIGSGQGQAVTALARTAFSHARTRLFQDLARRDRIVCIET